MEIIGKITGIRYKTIGENSLKQCKIEDFDVNQIEIACIIEKEYRNVSISKWDSPKKTHSHAYQRTYDALVGGTKSIVVIPVIKDEGISGECDFIEWETVFFMSLFNIYIIFAFYEKADKVNQKITNQQLSNTFVLKKLDEMSNYHSSAFHWNLNEIRTNFEFILAQVQLNYNKISAETGIQLHSEKGIADFQHQINQDVEAFLYDLPLKMMNDKFIEVQPLAWTKVQITIFDYLRGSCVFTIDEMLILNQVVQLIEVKHTQNSLLPSINDIKDGLLNMVLYANLKEVSIDGQIFKSESVLKLTSTQIIGAVNSNENEKKLISFCDANSLPNQERIYLKNLFLEAKTNCFIVKIEQTGL